MSRFDCVKEKLSLKVLFFGFRLLANDKNNEVETYLRSKHCYAKRK